MIRIALLMVASVLAIPLPAFATTYYVDSSISDTNVASATPDCTNYDPVAFVCSGGSASAYKTLADVNAKVCTAGDVFMLRAGQTWRETLRPGCSGVTGNPVRFTSFGSGAKPLVTALDVKSSFTQESSTSDTTIASAAFAATARGMRSLVFTSSSIGYAFFIDGDTGLKYTKTTDSGNSWGTPVVIKSASVAVLGAYDVWFDQWTPGDSGTIIHVWYTDFSADNVFYVQLDTSTDTLGTERTVFDGASAVNVIGHHVTGTKAKGGNLYCSFDIDAGAETGTYRSTDTGTTWASRTNIIEATADWSMLFPGNAANTQNVWALYFDASADELSIKIIDDSANTVTETSIATSVTENTTDETGQYPFTGTIRNSDGHLIVAVITQRVTATATANFRVFDVNGSSIAEKTAIASSTKNIYYPAIYLKQSDGSLYVAYNGKRDGSESLDTATGIYYTISTDGGVTWSSGDTSYSNVTNDWRQVWVSPTGPRFIAMYRDLSSNLLASNYGRSVPAPSSYTYWWVSNATLPYSVVSDSSLVANVANKTDLVSGSWWFDSVNGRVYFGSDPTGHTIEIGARQAFRTNSQSFLAIDGLRFSGQGTRFGYCVTLDDSSSDIQLTNTEIFLATTGISPASVLGNNIVMGPGLYIHDLYGNGIGASTGSPPTGWSVTQSEFSNIGTTQSRQLVNPLFPIGIYSEVPLVVSQNKIHDIYNGAGQLPTTTHGIYLLSAANSIVTGNLVYNVAGSGLKFSLGADGGVASYNVMYANGGAIELTGANNITIVNNTLWGNVGTGTKEAYGVQAYSLGGTSSEIRLLANNIIGENSLDGVSRQFIIFSPSVITAADNNLMYFSGSSDLGSYQGSTKTWTQWKALGFDAHGVNAIAQFTNTGANDFTLKSTSPAINAGQNLGSAYRFGLKSTSTWPSAVVTADQNQNRQWEIGAYVFAQSGPRAPQLASPRVVSPVWIAPIWK